MTLTRTTLITLMALILAAMFPGRLLAGYESPEYTVVLQDGPFEIRDYPGMTLVSTAMTRRGEDGSFMKLFRFIRGRNERLEEIAMTAPVMMSGAATGTMSFILPREVAAKGAPLPLNPEVTLSAHPAARYAVCRFRGSTSLTAGQEVAGRLRTWAAGKNLPVRGEPLFAYYNPPWTPGFLRRNEVMILLDSSDSRDARRVETPGN
jgi:SOUL heme-binding protein